MIRFIPGYCEIDTTTHELRQFMNDVYYFYYKKNRIKHIAKKDERYPNLKITGDIVSLAIWIKTDDGEEQRIFLDGDIFLNGVIIHTVTVDGEQFTEEAFQEIRNVLIKLSEIGKGTIYFDVNRNLVRLEKGVINKYPELIQELYNDLPEDKKEQHQVLFEELNESFIANNK